MKKYIMLCVFLSGVYAYAQQTIQYSFSVNATFQLNKHFGESEYEESEDALANIFELNAIFIRNGFDVKLMPYITAGIHLGYDYHSSYDLQAMPYYLDTKISLGEDGVGRTFVSFGYGKLIKLNRNFERGTLWKAGLGFQGGIGGGNKALVLLVDYNQKQIKGFRNGKLQSVSLGLGLVFL